MQFFRNGKSIARSVLLWMMAVAVLPLLIMAGQGYHCARQAVIQMKTDQLKAVLEGKKNRIVDWLKEREGGLGLLATYPCSEKACNPDLSSNRQISETCEILNHARNQNPEYDSIALYSHDWNLIATSQQNNHHQKEALLPQAFRDELQRSAGSISSTPHFHEDGMIGIHMGMPVSGQNNNKTGYVIAVLDLSASLYPILKSNSGSDSISTYIVSPEGHYYSHPTQGIQLLEDQSALPRMLLNGNADSTTVYQNKLGETLVATTTPIKELGWVLISESNTADAFAWLYILQQRALITGLATLILVFILANKSSQRLTYPLRRLADVAHSISEGRFEQRLETFEGKEHREVAEAFNRMLDEIDAAQQKLIHTAALSAIGQLSASIVHEMRNPLSAIKMNLQVLQRKMSDDALHKELAEIASDQVLRLEDMLTDLLQYGKKLELKVCDVNFDAFADDVIQCVRPPSDGKQVSVSMHNESQQDTVYIDREHMLRAISNLADNAVHETPDGGSVNITVLDSKDDPDIAIITISDTGPGVPDRVADKLFEPFFTTKSNGVGLGLPNVKKIIELHGGTIAFKNSPEGGAVFTITLPRNGKRI